MVRHSFLMACVAGLFVLVWSLSPAIGQSDLLQTGSAITANGYLGVSVDAFGSVADPSFGGGGDRFNPAGAAPLIAQRVTFSNGFFFFSGGTQRELLSTSSNWQSTGTPTFGSDASLTSTITSPNVVSDGNSDGVNDTAVSGFSVTGGGTDVSVQLTQVVSVLTAGTSAALTQDYEFTNNSASPLSFSLIRAWDSDLVWTPGGFDNDNVGTTTNGSGLALYVYQSEVAHGAPATVVLSSPQATSYYGGKEGVTTSGVAFGFGTDTQQWDAFGVPSGWANNIAGVGVNTNGDSGSMPSGALSDGFIGLGFDVQLNPGQSTTITVNYTYGQATPPGSTDGDFNNDGNYNCLDIDALVGDIAAGNNTASFDLTGDGLVNTADRDAWLLEAGEANIGPGRAYKLGDASLDGVVDGTDFGTWNSHKFTSVPEWCSGDFTADGVVDGSDFGAWNSNKFTSSDSATVPEPSVLAGLALWLIGIGMRGRRRAR